MACRISRLIYGLGVLGAILLAPLPSPGQRMQPGMQGGGQGTSMTLGPATGSVARASLMVMVRDPSGGPIDLALVTIELMAGGTARQATTDMGRADFYDVGAGDYTVQVVSAGYETARQSVNVDPGGAIVSIVLRPSPNGALPGGSGPAAMPVLAPKAQKLLAKAAESLRAGKPADARHPLEQAFALAPGHPYVNFLYGVYSARMNDWAAAESYWQKALNIFPKHYASLLYLSDALLRENRAAEAVPHLNRAIEVDPGAWRPHAMLAQALLSQRQFEDAIKEADRALELGQTQAAGVEPLLARALVAQGDKERAITVLQNYLHDRPGDSAAQRMLDSLRAP